MAWHGTTGSTHWTRKTRSRALRARFGQISFSQSENHFFIFCKSRHKKFVFRVQKNFRACGGRCSCTGLERPVESREYRRSIPFGLLYRLVHFQLDLIRFDDFAETVLTTPHFREIYILSVFQKVKNLSSSNYGQPPDDCHLNLKTREKRVFTVH